jgi:hypothetical protein
MMYPGRGILQYSHIQAPNTLAETCDLQGDISMMIRNRLGLWLVFLLCVLPGCNAVNPTLSFPTGINGVAITESGGGNVYPPPPVTHSPLAGAIITIQPAGGGVEIARGVADAKGGFRIELAPGTYDVSGLVPPDVAFILAPEQQTVVVSENALTQVVVTYKTISHF